MKSKAIMACCSLAASIYEAIRRLKLKQLNHRFIKRLKFNTSSEDHFKTVVEAHKSEQTLDAESPHIKSSITSRLLLSSPCAQAW